jgi:elongator complex protein 5
MCFLRDPQAPPDPTQNLSFNVNLTPSQQESRAQVPLPYAHEGKPPEIPTSSIIYDPDSADDIDDDDPDEDLDI